MHIILVKRSFRLNVFTWNSVKRSVNFYFSKVIQYFFDFQNTNLYFTACKKIGITSFGIPNAWLLEDDLKDMNQ